MSNFLNFIEEDIENKKLLLSTMPIKLKRDIKKFNEKVDFISEKYAGYRANVKKYIEAKAKSCNVKPVESQIDDIKKKIDNLEEVRFILNPTNSFLEKMKLDELLYQIGDYNDLNFNLLNEYINQFLNKFEEAGIILKKDDFDYTCYVNEYMSAFLEVKHEGKNNYDKIAEVFEKIYWANPDIINHIELCFRNLLKKNEKAFESYIIGIQNKIKDKNNITDYKDCLNKLKEAYNELNEMDKETIHDIIKLAKSGAIDVSSYFENSKIRVSTYSNMIIDNFDMTDKNLLNKFHSNLVKLKRNIDEYEDYTECIPLIDNFKKEYEKFLPKTNSNPVANTKDSNVSVNNLKSIEEKIYERESKLDKINKLIMGDDTKVIFGIKVPKLPISKSVSPSQLKIDSISLAKELYDLYKQEEKEIFKNKVLEILSKNTTLSEFLNLYYSYSYFNKQAIKKVYATNDYDEILKYTNKFNDYAKNMTNVITPNLTIFEDNNIAKIIVNKYRLNNINLTEEDLNPSDLTVLSNKIKFMLRINEIENSETNIEKVWFLSQAEKIIKND